MARLVREISELPPLKTVYFGGGTPALCELSPLKLPLAAGAEFTVELHPLDVTPAKLDELRLLGVNRISMGVQSLDNAVLTAMGRGHTAEQAETAFRRVREVFPNAGLDLIAGWPGVTDEMWRETLTRALALEPVHISCYTLIREAHTLLDRRVREGRYTLPDDDAALAQITVAAEAFAAVGLRRYEVSNYALEGRECRHNLAVWRGEDYRGLGDGAHGREGRFRTIGNGGGYERTEVTELEDVLERTLLALRTSEGINLEEVKHRFPQLTERIPIWRARLTALSAEGILEHHGLNTFAPNARGFEVCDAVMAEM